MGNKEYFIRQCKETQDRRDKAKTLEEKEYYQKLLDTAVQDLIGCST